MTDGQTPPLTKYTAPRSVLAHMGSIIRAGADIDYAVTLALFKIANIGFEIGFALLDRMMLGSKIAKLRYFVEADKEEKYLEKFKEIEERLAPFVQIRNTIAHGVIIGSSGRDIIFLLMADYTNHLGSFVSEVAGASPDDLKTAAHHGPQIAEALMLLFDVSPLQETVRYTFQEEKPTTLKSQRKSNLSKSRKPPQSSRA